MEAGPRPSQEAQPAGLSQDLSQDGGDRRPGVDVAAAWLGCSTGKGQRYKPSLKAVPKEKGREALISSFLQQVLPAQHLALGFCKISAKARDGLKKAQL